MRLVVKMLNFDDIKKQCKKRINELLSKPSGIIINDNRRFDENSEPPENYVAPKRKPNQTEKWEKLKSENIKKAMLEESIRGIKEAKIDYDARNFQEQLQRLDTQLRDALRWGTHNVYLDDVSGNFPKHNMPKPSIPEGRLEIISEDEITNLKISLARNEDLSKL